MAIAEAPDGNVLVSGGPTRGWLFRFTSDGGDALTPLGRGAVPDLQPGLRRRAAGSGRRPAAARCCSSTPTPAPSSAQYGDGITMAMAVDPATGLIYVAKGPSGPAASTASAAASRSSTRRRRRSRHYSRDLNLRVATLAFAPDGTLWATTWPDRRQVVRFNAQPAPR